MESLTYHVNTTPSQKKKYICLTLGNKDRITTMSNLNVQKRTRELNKRFAFRLNTTVNIILLIRVYVFWASLKIRPFKVSAII